VGFGEDADDDLQHLGFGGSAELGKLGIALYAFRQEASHSLAGDRFCSSRRRFPAYTSSTKSAKMRLCLIAAANNNCVATSCEPVAISVKPSSSSVSSRLRINCAWRRAVAGVFSAADCRA
jgi:hypothetical protein